MSTFSGDTGREEEDGGGWSRLAPSKEERKAEAIAKVNQGMLEALKNTTQTLRLLLVPMDPADADARAEVRNEIRSAEAAISNAEAQLEKK